MKRRGKQSEIAKIAGVSVSTVSRTLNGIDGITPQLRERVWAAATQLGYTRQSNIKQRPLEQIGFITPLASLGSSSDPFHTDILKGAEKECQRYNIRLRVIVVEKEANSDFVTNKIMDNKLDGAILLSVDDDALLTNIIDSNVAAACINIDNPDAPIDQFLPSNCQGAITAVRHLIKFGHRHILHVTNLRRMTIQRRHKGYKLALRQAGIDYDPSLVLETLLGIEDAYHATKKYLSSQAKKFTAVFCANDHCAIGVMQALLEEGYAIPEDISIIGYDDIPLAAYMSPALTTMRIEREELGMLAVRRIVARGRNLVLSPVRVELVSKLIERETVSRVAHE